MTAWRPSIDLATAIDGTERLMARITRWMRRLAVAGWVGSVVFTLAFTGRWIIDGGVATVAALLVLALTAIPGTILYVLARMLQGSVDDMREAIGVLQSWSASGEREEKVERLRASAARVAEAEGRIRQVVAGIGVVRTARSELAALRSISPPGRTLVLSSSYVAMWFATTGVAGTILVCWMAAGMAVIRAIAELS